MKKPTNIAVTLLMSIMLISTTFVDARPGFRGGGVMNIHPPAGGGAHFGGGGEPHFGGGGTSHFNGGSETRLGGGGSGERFAGGGDHPPPHPGPGPHPNPPGPHPYPPPPGPGPHPNPPPPPPPGPGPHPYPYPPPPPPPHGGDWYYDDYPVATAVAVTAGVALTAAAIGSVVYSVPNNCVPVYVNNITYQQCGSTWYQPRYAGTTVQYVVVAPPR